MNDEKLVAELVEKHGLTFLFSAQAAIREALLSRETWIAVTPETMPTNIDTVLCRGSSYDSQYDDGYFVASWMGHWTEPRWSMGKQQVEPFSVTHWMPLPTPPADRKEQ